MPHCNKPHCVLLPGWAMPTTVWGQFAEYLATQYSVIQVDSFATNHIDNIIAGLANLIDEPSYFIGWSLGGLVLQLFAAQYPQYVKKAIALNATPCFIANENWPGIPPAEYRSFYRLAKRDISGLLQHFVRQVFSEASRPDVIYQQLFAQLPRQDALLASLELLKSLDARLQLAALQVPMQFIFSEDDQVVPIATAAAMQKLSSHLMVKTIVGDHAPFFHHPEKTARLMMEFFNE